MADKSTLGRLAAASRIWHPNWVEKSVWTYLVENHAGEQDYPLTVAAIACWADPSTETPARLKENGPWWRAAKVAASLERGALKGAPSNREECQVTNAAGQKLHPGQWADACSGCRADALVEATGRTD